MPNSDSLTDYKDADHIKSVVQPVRTEAIHPDPGASPEFSLLPERHGLDRPAEPGVPTGLDLHEGNRVALTHHQVDVAVPAAEAMRDHRPPRSPKPSRRDAFTEKAQCLPLFRHGARVTGADEGASPFHRTRIVPLRGLTHAAGRTLNACTRC